LSRRAAFRSCFGRLALGSAGWVETLWVVFTDFMGILRWNGNEATMWSARTPVTMRDPSGCQRGGAISDGRWTAMDGEVGTSPAIVRTHRPVLSVSFASLCS